jgi:hypothetical protein
MEAERGGILPAGASETLAMAHACQTAVRSRCDTTP